MKIKDVFEPNGIGGVRSKKTVTVRSSSGSATFAPGQEMNAQSSMAGVSGQWILDNLNSDVPSNWLVPEVLEPRPQNPKK